MRVLIKNMAQLVSPVASEYATGEAMGKLNIKEDVSLLIEDGLILSVIKRGDLPYADEIIDAGGRVVMPTFTDPHTHLPFAGSRQKEFNMRIQGKGYMEIAASGGGINSTVKATRDASEDELYDISTKHLDMMIKHGTGSLEMKSGYGLNTESELKQLRVIKKLKSTYPTLDIKATFMGAHEIPLEYRGNKEGYIELVVNEMLPAVKEQGVADYCDVFCEKNVFEIAESRRILLSAIAHGFKVRLHADEIVPLKGAELAAELKAVSADHLMCISDEGIAQMVASGTVFTLLPGTTFFLMSDSYAPAKKIIEAGGIVALSTDFNPGSSFTHSMPFIINLACLKMGMTINQAINAATLNGAYAIELADKTGSIHEGKQADLLFLDAPSYEFLVYNFAVNRVAAVMKKGKIIYDCPGLSRDSL